MCKARSLDWQTVIDVVTTATNSPVRATALTYLVRAEQQVGAVDQTIADLEQLIAYYRQTGNRMQVGRMQTEQAQAYSSLGQQRKAIALLCRDESDRDPSDQLKAACRTDSALAIARHQADTIGEIAALGSLGNAYRLHGDYDDALHYLQAALTLATQTQQQPQRLAALNGSGQHLRQFGKAGRSPPPICSTVC